MAALWWTICWRPCWTKSSPLDDGGDGGLICTIFTMGSPEIIAFWRKKLASYMYEGYASKSAFPAGSGLTAKRIRVLVEDLLASYMYEGYASKSAFPAGSGLTAKRIRVLVEDLLATDRRRCRCCREIGSNYLSRPTVWITKVSLISCGGRCTLLSQSLSLSF